MAVVRKLKPKKIPEISLVPKGANPLSDVLVVKGGEGAPVHGVAALMQSLRDAFTAVVGKEADRTALDAALQKAEDALTAKVVAPPVDPGVIPPAVQNALDALDAVAKGAGTCKKCKKGKPCKEHAMAYHKAKQGIAAKMAEAVSTSEAFAENQMWRLVDALQTSLYSIMHDDDVTDKSTAMQESFKQFMGLVATAAGTPIAIKEPLMPDLNPQPEAVTVTKEQWASMQEQLTTLQKSAESAMETAAKAQKELSDAQEQQALAALTLEAKELLGTMPGDVGVIAGILKGMTVEQKAELQNVLKAAGERAKAAALFGELGSPDRKTHDADSAAAALKVKANEIRATKEVSSAAEAYALASQRFPELYSKAMGVS